MQVQKRWDVELKLRENPFFVRELKIKQKDKKNSEGKHKVAFKDKASMRTLFRVDGSFWWLILNIIYFVVGYSLSLFMQCFFLHTWVGINRTGPHQVMNSCVLTHLQYSLSTYVPSNWTTVVWSRVSLICPCWSFQISALFYSLLITLKRIRALRCYCWCWKPTMSCCCFTFH